MVALVWSHRRPLFISQGGNDALGLTGRKNTGLKGAFFHRTMGYWFINKEGSLLAFFLLVQVVP